MRPRCTKVIVVEGKYDKIRIESLLDATVITTEGFGIFKNEEKRNLLKQLAEKRGLARMSSQAVGGAVGWNPLCLIIPCHRVVGADGSLTGYGGGIENKQVLLKLEGVKL